VAQTPLQCLQEMLQAIDKVETLKYELKAHELIDEKLVLTHSIVKYQKSPLNIYNILIFPDEGLEVLYNYPNNNVLVNPNGFPFINLNLDPYGKLMRKGQHHTIFETGFDFLKSIINYLMPEIIIEPKKYLKDLGIKQKGKNKYRVIELNNPDFSYTKYKVKENKNVVQIAKENFISAYLILQKNNLSFYDDVVEGKIIEIPNTFAEKLEIWIDESTKLPLFQKIYVEGNLFESYEFLNIKVNPPFNTHTFSAENKEYGF